MATVHVIGAGLAGLSAAVRLSMAGRDVVVHEAAGHAGGRCRSFHDPVLDRRIDNGNHLLLSGNLSLLAYIDAIGAADELSGMANGGFPFLDIESGERWTVSPGGGFFPWWIFKASRRVPGTGVVDYLKALRLLRAGGKDTVAEVLDDGGALYRLFWEPLAVSILNTAAKEAAASLLASVLRETFGRGGKACRPLIARRGLSETFILPALKFLDRRGVKVRFNQRIRQMVFAERRVAELYFGDEGILLGPDDAVVLAVPPASARRLVPGLITPTASRAIVNCHFLLPAKRPALTFIGIIGGLSHWLFVRGGVASVTLSAGEAIVDEPAEKIAVRMWPEVARALDLGAWPPPPCRVVKEKRATFAQTPAEIARRPAARGEWQNLFLAGDWTATGLPATMEGAVRSGEIAARLARKYP
jgi:squalene-associated FAD-dependent desaturase